MASRPAGDSRPQLYRAGALLVTVLIAAAVLAAVLTSGSTSDLAPGRPVPGAAQTLALFAGIPQRGPALGDPRAPLTLVEFGDLQCPSCADFATRVLPTLLARYVRRGRLRLEFRALRVIGADSERAARMAGALGLQDRMWQFNDLMYRNQGLENSGYVTDTYLRALAGAIPGVDVPRVLIDRASPAVSAELDQAHAQAQQLGLQGTPAFLLARPGRPPRVLTPAGPESGSYACPIERALAGGEA